MVLGWPLDGNDWSLEMKVVVRAQLITDWGEVSDIVVAEVGRPAIAFDANTLGLSLNDGKRILQQLQQVFAAAQADELCALHRACQRCRRWNPIKDYRQRKVETVFGPIRLTSPRIVSCPCEPPWYLETPYSPLVALIRERATPELQLLHGKPCASMSYRQAASGKRQAASGERQAASVLREFLPVGEKFNHVTLRNRTLRVGERIDRAPRATASAGNVKATALWTFAIDGGFVRGIGKGELRNSS